MDASKYAEGSFCNPEVVKNSQSKQCCITGIKSEMGKYGEQIVCDVEIDGNAKRYSPSKDTVKNLISTWGKDTNAWLGRTILLQVLSIAGKDRVMGTGVK